MWKLRCNECGAVVGVIQIDILRGLLALGWATATCPNCGQDMFPRHRRGVDLPSATAAGRR
jgi:hypothetical protein